MKENNIEELCRTQQARLEVGADDLDIREEIKESRFIDAKKDI